MMERLLPILVPVAALVPAVFVIALCPAAARAETVQSCQPSERRDPLDASERAAHAPIPSATPLVAVERFAPNGNLAVSVERTFPGWPGS
jgi:hypothetical protein